MKKKLNSIGNAKTKEIIYDRRGRPIPKGTVLRVFEDEHCSWGYLVAFPKYKTLTGFYDKELFEIIKEEDLD